MAEETYEFACMRAELLGIEKPDQEKFELENAERIKAEKEALAAAQAQELESNDETIKSTGGELDELNRILTSTQRKLNNLKKTACGSLTSLFKSQSVDENGASKSGSSMGSKNATDGLQKQSSLCATSENFKNDANNDNSVNSALDNLEKMETIEKESDAGILKNTSLDLQKKMTSHLGALDSLIEKADKAELSMAAQSKDMRRFLKE